jgi:hypothetical protein
MSRIDRKCPSCKKRSGTKGPFCQYCGAVMTPSTEPESEQTRPIDQSQSDEEQFNADTNNNENEGEEEEMRKNQNQSSIDDDQQETQESMEQTQAEAEQTDPSEEESESDTRPSRPSFNPDNIIVPQREDRRHKSFGWIIVVIAIVAIIAIVALIWHPWNTATPNKAAALSASTSTITTTTTPTATSVAVATTPSTTTVSDDNVFSLGKPANPTDVDPKIWNKPMSDGVMITSDGIVYYVQSGKNGSKTLKGKIPEGAYLVLDAFTISKTTNGKIESFTNGNLYIIVGPLDLDVNPINYVDGCAQYIGKDGLQNLLDNNIAVKFARGDWSKKKNQWSYRPWALTNFWLPDGYKFNKLTLTYQTDTYPNRDNPTD